MAAALMAIRDRNKKRRQQEEEAAANEPTEEEKAREMMLAIDADGDGNVTQEEIMTYMLQKAAKEAAAAAAEAAAKAAARRGRDLHIKLPYRGTVKNFYEHPLVQKAVAFVILFNFIAIVIEKSIDPYPSEYQIYPSVWLIIDDICNIFFVVELVINIYGDFLLPFFMSGWNWLDLIVVITGTVTLARVDLGSFARIKVLRAFRVLRLFKRIKSLNKILVALGKAIPGVLNAFVVMLIFMTIYAVLAVDLFRDFGQTSSYETRQAYGPSDGQFGEYCGVDGVDCIAPSALKFQNVTTVSAITPRGFYVGQEYYGDFFRALFTLFQVLTGESWSEAIVRPLLFGWSPTNAVVVAIFFTSYILLTQVVLQNVVVAVLLDKFVEDADTPNAQASNDGVLPVADASLSDSGGFPSPQALPQGMPGSSRRGAGVESDAVAELRGTMDKLIVEQASMKAMLELILRRLPEEKGTGRFEA